MKTRLNQLKQDYEPYKAQEELSPLLAILPTLGENLRMAQLCKGVGLTVEAIKKLFRGEQIVFTVNYIRPNTSGILPCRTPDWRLSKIKIPPISIFFISADIILLIDSNKNIIN